MYGWGVGSGSAAAGKRGEDVLHRTLGGLGCMQEVQHLPVALALLSARRCLPAHVGVLRTGRSPNEGGRCPLPKVVPGKQGRPQDIPPVPSPWADHTVIARCRASQQPDGLRK